MTHREILEVVAIFALQRIADELVTSIAMAIRERVQERKRRRARSAKKRRKAKRRKHVPAGQG